jgi:eukaryotic-like serine/threonine-protein kinase
VVAAKLIDSGANGRQHIDRYELVAEIATGGMATVYLARLSGVGGFQRFVAIKQLHPHLAGEQEFVEMFLDEARLAAGIHHPNVVPILEVGASERGYYLVMEYIEGDTLARLLARAASQGNRLPPEIGIRILIDMLAGLHAAHELRDEMGQPTELVHRDVSPQNVLVGTDGITRIADFGVARASARLSATRVGQLKGKVAYMAPEQAMGKSDIDRRADVFAAGIVLWEVLAGRRLFKSETEAGTLSRVLSEPIVNVSELNPEIDVNLAQVCMRALTRDRDQRYATCALFADALERAASRDDKVASARQLASYVADVIGHEIEQQRDAVRAWLARSEPSQLSLPGSQPSSSPSRHGVDRSGITLAALPPSAGPARRRSPLVWLGGVALLAALIAVGVLLARGRTLEAVPGQPEATVVSEPASRASAPPPPTAEERPAASVAPEVQPSAAAPPPSADPVRAAPKPTVTAPPWRGGTGSSRKGGDTLPSNPYR